MVARLIAASRPGGNAERSSCQFKARRHKDAQAADIAEDRLALARSPGADVTLDAAEVDVAYELQSQLGGVHGVLVTAVSNSALSQAVGMLRRGGFMSLADLPPADFPLPIFEIVLKRVTVRGSIMGTRNDPRESLDFAGAGKVASHFIWDRLENINAIFDKSKAGQIEGRIVLEIWPRSHLEQTRALRHGVRREPGGRQVRAAGQERRQAICLCLDAAFLPVALFLACQIDAAAPGRTYDICLCSDGAIALPADLATRDFRLVRLSPPLAYRALPSGPLAHSTYLRLWLVEALGDDYDRLLYLDSDMFLLRGDPGDLFAVDLGGRSIGAVRDMQQWSDPLRHVGEFVALGFPALPYFNAGLMLIDTARFRDGDLCGRALCLAQDHPEAVWHHDQSLLNGVLRGAFAELSPVWNWQWVGKRPLFTARADVRLVHFVGHGKPWNEESDTLPQRYRQSYATFLERYFPGSDLLRGTGAARPSGLARRIRTLGQHALSYPAYRRLMRRFPDPLRAAS